MVVFEKYTFKDTIIPMVASETCIEFDLILVFTGNGSHRVHYI